MSHRGAKLDGTSPVRATDLNQPWYPSWSLPGLASSSLILPNERPRGSKRKFLESSVLSGRISGRYVLSCFCAFGFVYFTFGMSFARKVLRPPCIELTRATRTSMTWHATMRGAFQFYDGPVDCNDGWNCHVAHIGPDIHPWLTVSEVGAMYFFISYRKTPGRSLVRTAL